MCDTQKEKSCKEWKCRFCGIILASRRKMYAHCKNEHKDEFKHPWNRGLTKETSDLLVKSANTYKRRITEGIIIPKGVKHTQQTREKMSESHKKAVAEGRNKGWATTRTNGKSYPETFFTKVIENEFTDKNYKFNLPFYTWKLDFAWPAKKRCIEIDGSQHNKSIQKESDKRKDEKLLQHGWKVLRIRWIDLFHNTKDFIEQAKKFIYEGIVLSVEPYINPSKLHKKKKNRKKVLNKEISKKVKKEKVYKAYNRDKTGRLNSNVLDESIWQSRYNLIINSNVNLLKFGYVEQLIKSTGLSKRIIANTIKRFNIPVFKKTFKNF